MGSIPISDALQRAIEPAVELACQSSRLCARLVSARNDDDLRDLQKFVDRTRETVVALKVMASQENWGEQDNPWLSRLVRHQQVTAEIHRQDSNSNNTAI